MQNFGLVELKSGQVWPITPGLRTRLKAVAKSASLLVGTNERIPNVGKDCGMDAKERAHRLAANRTRQEPNEVCLDDAPRPHNFLHCEK